MSVNGDVDGRPNRALAVVSLAVLLASSTWFSGTAAADALRNAWHLTDEQSASLTTSVQLGFIVGTIAYAALNLADVFNPRRVFAASALAGALFNVGFAATDSLAPALLFRFITGVTLAGVYPVGMKIVATWFSSGLGWRLGVMVGALTIGTALPYLWNAAGTEFAWGIPVWIASASAVVGAGLVGGFLRDGPFLRGRAPFAITTALRAFRHPPFRRTAFGYFGHMWELYALWALVGFYARSSFAGHPGWIEATPWLSFAVVAIGAIGCVAGGWLSRTLGERKIALFSLIASATFCLFSGLLAALPPPVLALVLLAWGVVVVSDSPQFSALAARHAPAGYTGTALTIQNGIGFAITIGSLQLLPWLAGHVGWRWAFIVLAVGPILGALAVFRLPEHAEAS